MSQPHHYFFTCLWAPVDKKGWTSIHVCFCVYILCACMKRWSTSLIIRETQVKTTMQHHRTHVRIAITKMARNNECCALLVCVLCKLVLSLWNTVRRFLKKLKTEYDPSISLLGIHPKRTKTLIWKKCMHPYVHQCIIYNSQDMETT